MKKISLIMLGCLICHASAASWVLAVMPPATSLAEEPGTSQANTPAGTENLRITSDRARQIVDRLEEDEKRLEIILKDLQEKKNRVKEQTHDGHSIR